MTSTIFPAADDEHFATQDRNLLEDDVTVSDTASILYSSDEGEESNVKNVFESDDELDERTNKKVLALQQLYAEGKPMYPRDQLRSAARQIAEGADIIRIKSWNGITYKTPVDCTKYGVPCLGYVAFHHLERYAKRVRNQKYDLQPIHIDYVDRKLFWYSEDKVTTETLKLEFAKQAEIWRRGDMATAIKDELAKMDYVPTKVVGIALGSLVRAYNCLDREDFFSNKLQELIQYAALWAIGGILEELGAKKVEFFAQDPALTKNKDKSVLNHFNITALDDPWGLLEIDESTVVLCVAPSFCCPQIIADDANFWPAAFISLDMILDAEDEKHEITGLELGYAPCYVEGQRFRDMIQKSFNLRKKLPEADGFRFPRCKRRLKGGEEVEVTMYMDMITRKGPLEGTVSSEGA
ncbi:hypothetical protein BT63DRAFT_463889 [Microthyrium microscopicum]|uniref:SRR1-like domain-containing protein n=1 Tax=Microthyrium microscopicum TaxID=703497 RepID=A0A6A6U184_9PEZI|nr:hypothetical protein BT63DRAFT_463889 [Microthyrium microscopicum]